MKVYEVRCLTAYPSPGKFSHRSFWRRLPTLVELSELLLRRPEGELAALALDHIRRDIGPENVPCLPYQINWTVPSGKDQDDYYALIFSEVNVEENGTAPVEEFEIPDWLACEKAPEGSIQMPHPSPESHPSCIVVQPKIVLT